MPEAEHGKWAEAKGLADDVGGGVASHELVLVAALLGIRKLSHGLLMYDAAPGSAMGCSCTPCALAREEL